MKRLRWLVFFIVFTCNCVTCGEQVKKTFSSQSTLNTVSDTNTTAHSTITLDHGAVTIRTRTIYFDPITGKKTSATYKRERREPSKVSKVSENTNHTKGKTATKTGLVTTDEDRTDWGWISRIILWSSIGLLIIAGGLKLWSKLP